MGKQLQRMSALGSLRLRDVSTLAGGNGRRAPSTSLNLKIGLATPSLEKIWPVCQTNSPQALERSFESQKRGQLFIRAQRNAFHCRDARLQRG